MVCLDDNIDKDNEASLFVVGEDIIGISLLAVRHTIVFSNTTIYIKFVILSESYGFR